MPRRILVTGATGFIGGATRRLLGASPNVRLRLVSHTRAPSAADANEGAWVQADLTQPSTLRGLCDDIDLVLHAASCVEEDEQQCLTVNVRGTEALVAEARRAGVRAFVYVSTTAVYGSGGHVELGEDACVPQPESPASRTRLAAEGLVRELGGTIVRAPFTYGSGDRWFIPKLVELMRRYPQLAQIELPTRLSVISIDDLARVLAAMSLSDPTPGGVFHACHPRPIAIPELARLVHDLLKQLPPETAAGSGDVSSESSKRHLATLAQDRWYDSSRIWNVLQLSPGPSMVDAFAPEFAARYRAQLA